jgi:hypothetical protein
LTAARRWLLPGLLVLGAVLFVVGTSAERHNEAAVSIETAPAAEGTPTVEAALGATTTAAEGMPAAESAEGATATHSAATESSESTAEGKVLGINRESKGVVAIVAVISVALAGLAWALRRRQVFFVIAAFAALFAIFDIAEVAHQVDLSRTGLAVLAGVIAAVHIVATVLAGRAAMAATT